MTGGGRGWLVIVGGNDGSRCSTGGPAIPLHGSYHFPITQCLMGSGLRLYGVAIDPANREMCTRDIQHNGRERTFKYLLFPLPPILLTFLRYSGSQVNPSQSRDYSYSTRSECVQASSTGSTGAETEEVH